ncbi:MAG: 5-oxoprolinase/urea amidolyase family protein, partial [Pseudomonadales bacterium]|nr:5-oxoprolinase/urea amidolyase family protein [Pseudomonadales bacterium]
NGPVLKFNHHSRIAITGADIDATLDDEPLQNWRSYAVRQGQVLKMGKVKADGARAYLAVQGGIQCPLYLGSRSTFTLGQFGGHAGRALKTGDILHFMPVNTDGYSDNVLKGRPKMEKHWQLHVIYGPHGAPDFFTEKDIETFFEAEWQVHYNSSRTGVRLIGPKPEWARSDGGEAGMHPSNIHDNAYAIGTVDFTGDMPVILGPDGPSLGGFVCPATVIQADLWKLGQLKAGDKVSFIPVSIEAAVAANKQLQAQIDACEIQALFLPRSLPASPIIKRNDSVCFRPSGDHYLLVEFGEMHLDIALRFKAHALMLWLEENSCEGMQDLTPGIRSLQVHYDAQVLSLSDLIEHIESGLQQLGDIENIEVPARVVHLPLSWDDEACKLAIEKYMQSVRKDAPWCPSNIEFIRRINGLETLEDVKHIVFDASYLVMGLGDVYLGAPVATPLDPRHRLVTTKYNPARTWTAENSVGIGGSYLCIYGMEGPGGYQFVGRTLQMWNRYRKTAAFDKPWLLEFFDQIKFYEVSAGELLQIREDFPRGRYPIKIEQTSFSLKKYKQFLQQEKTGIQQFTQKREAAFEQELQRWIKSGQINFTVDQAEEELPQEDELADNEMAIESGVSGSVWQVEVEEGQVVQSGDVLMIVESMKMEIQIRAQESGRVRRILRGQGKPVSAGQTLMIMEMN